MDENPYNDPFSPKSLEIKIVGMPNPDNTRREIKSGVILAGVSAVIGTVTAIATQIIVGNIQVKQAVKQTIEIQRQMEEDARKKAEEAQAS